MAISKKISLRIHPIFWLLALMIAGLNSDFSLLGMAIWTLIIVVSVIVHEFGHALTAVAFGQKAHIDLVAFGGLTHRHGPHLKFPQEFLIVLNGPLAGLVLAFVCYFIAVVIGNKHSLLQYYFQMACYANVFWTVVNLLPVQPLDGGHLLRIFLEGTFGLKGLKVALFLSFIFSILLCLFLILKNFLIAGIFFMMFAYENYRAWRGSLGITDRDRDSNIQQLMKSAEKDYRKGHDDAALQKLEFLTQQTKKGVLFLNANQMMAEILEKQGRGKEAYQLLLPLKLSLRPESLSLLHKLAYRLGELDEAIALGTIAYQRHPSYESALINAFVYGIQGQAKPAIGWLQCAVKEGLPNLQEVLQEMEFNSIRDDPNFQNLAERYR